MQEKQQQKKQHLLWRAAFGPLPQSAIDSKRVDPSELYDILERKSTGTPPGLSVSNARFDSRISEGKDVATNQKRNIEQRKQQRMLSVEGLKTLNVLWLNEMIYSQAQLREKMSFFWHGHFACRVINISFQQQLLHSIRCQSLGDFGNLLRDVCKSAAMLSFLNNQQNRKQHPNENFARELLELFTIGRGNYTESDVKEAARAFTGWGFNRQGEFVERSSTHDNGVKTFMGKTGNFDGDEILHIILEQKATSKFISQKIYRFFVNEKPNEQIIEWMARKLYESDYHIGSLLRFMFTSSWFYEEKNMGNRIKSPIELIVGIRRFIPMDVERPQVQLQFQKALGQLLLYPPSVAGWPLGRSWIDSNSLMLRMRLPQIFTGMEQFSIRTKDDDDVMTGIAEKQMELQGYRNVLNWEVVLKGLEKVSRQDLNVTIENLVLQSPGNVTATIMDEFADKSSRAKYIQSLIVQYMCTPAYQLC